MLDELILELKRETKDAERRSRQMASRLRNGSKPLYERDGRVLAVEYGNGTTPPIPFIRSAVAANGERWEAEAERAVEEFVMEGNGSAKTAADRIGRTIREDVARSAEAFHVPREIVELVRR